MSETAKLRLRELTRLAGGQSFPSKTSVSIQPVIQKPGDPDKWGTFTAPSDGYFSLFGGRFGSVDVVCPSGIESCVWLNEQTYLLGGVIAPIRKGETLRYHFIQLKEGDVEYKCYFAPRVGAL